MSNICKKLLNDLNVEYRIVTTPNPSIDGRHYNCHNHIFKNIDEINVFLKDHVIALYALSYELEVDLFEKNTIVAKYANLFKKRSSIIMRYAVIREPDIIQRKIVNAIMEMANEDL